jgi:hypothetical protein
MGLGKSLLEQAGVAGNVTIGDFGLFGRPRGCARLAQSLHRSYWRGSGAEGRTMRAEIQNIVDEIKQSIGLLRRHL